MIRVASQLAFCSPNTIRQRMVVELDDQNCIKCIFSLDDGNVESEETLFYDGILSSGIVSLKQNISGENISKLINEYQYFDFSENLFTLDIKLTDKPLIIDLGTDLPDKINNLLPRLSLGMPSLSVFEIIAACTFYPALVIGRSPGLTEGQCINLILWENVDLINKKITVNTRIREMNPESSTIKTNHL